MVGRSMQQPTFAGGVARTGIGFLVVQHVSLFRILIDVRIR
jgi:hypothetical protein